MLQNKILIRAELSVFPVFQAGLYTEIFTRGGAERGGHCLFGSWVLKGWVAGPLRPRRLKGRLPCCGQHCQGIGRDPIF